MPLSLQCLIKNHKAGVLIKCVSLHFISLPLLLTGMLFNREEEISCSGPLSQKQAEYFLSQQVC